MAFPIVPALITLIANLPKIFTAINIFRPLKEKVKQVEKGFKPVRGATKNEINNAKHKAVLEFAKKKLAPYLKKFDISESDLNVTISFIVLFVKKITALGFWKRRKKSK